MARFLRFKRDTPHFFCLFEQMSSIDRLWILKHDLPEPLAEQRSMSATFPERTNAVAAAVISIPSGHHQNLRSSGIAALLLRFGPLFL